MKQYFPHDFSARHDPKVVNLIVKFGYVGYAVYFMILEWICEGGIRSIKPSDYQAAAYDLHMPLEKVTEYMEYLSSADSGLLEKDDKEGIYSRRMNAFLDSLKNNKSLKPNKETDAKPKKTTHKAELERTYKERLNAFKQMILSYVDTHQIYDIRGTPKYEEKLVEAFISSWTEGKPNNEYKMKFEYQDFWDTGKRLATWIRNDEKWFHGTGGGNKNSIKRAENNRVLEKMAREDPEG